MPDFGRFLTRAGEDYQKYRGSTDRLCAARAMLSPHPRLQAFFMAAMREALAWHCLHHPELARACWQADCWPRGLRHWEDLERLPRVESLVHSPQQLPRDLRRWTRVLENSLADLGWSRPRRRCLWARPDCLHWHEGDFPMFEDESGQCRWPRVVRLQAGRLFCPVYRSRSLLSTPETFTTCLQKKMGATP